MQTVTATDLARNFRAMLNRVEFQHEELLVKRNNCPVARLVPDHGIMTAAEAFSDLYRTLPPDAGESWLVDSLLDEWRSSRYET